MKHVAFWTGDMDVAVEMYEISKRFPLGSYAKIVRWVDVNAGNFSQACFRRMGLT